MEEGAGGVGGQGFGFREAGLQARVGKRPPDGCTAELRGCAWYSGPDVA